MDAGARFAAIVQGPEDAIRLDEGALLIAAHAHPGLDVAAQQARLDDLAAGCAAPTLDALVEHLFHREGFAGNRGDYYDPANSYLDAVLERRLGIPITLSILAIEVGRRIGVPLVGVGMPGHFLVRAAGDADAFVDPFAGGARLDRQGCARRYEEVQGAGARLDGDLLAPVGVRAVLARLLANLKGIHLARRDRTALAWVLKLRVEVPGVAIEERRELASVLAADGRFRHAAVVLERLVELAGPGPLAEEAARGASRLRARLN